MIAWSKICRKSETIQKQQITTTKIHSHNGNKYEIWCWSIDIGHGIRCWIKQHKWPDRIEYTAIETGSIDDDTNSQTQRWRQFKKASILHSRIQCYTNSHRSGRQTTLNTKPKTVNLMYISLVTLIDDIFWFVYVFLFCYYNWYAQCSLILLSNGKACLSKKKLVWNNMWYDLLYVCVYVCVYICSEEAMVMANLRKRVAACDLERRRPVSDARTNEPNQDELDNRPLLSKVR